MFKKKILILVPIIMLLILIEASQSGEKSAVSEYNLYEPSHYSTFGKAKKSPGIVKTTEGDNIYTSGLIDDRVTILGSLDKTSYFIQSYKSSDKIKSLTYFPSENTIYSFGRDKPINLLILSTPTDSENPYNSPLYIGYHDGTCEYPEEFDYVRNKSKCNQYLRDTLDFVGYGSVDEMLEDVFGDYITKGTDKREVSN